MSADRDYYRILHVQPDAPAAIIHTSYRELEQRLRNNREEMALLDEAYAVLSNPERRAAYDLQRDIAASQRLRRPAFESSDTLARTARFGAARCIFCGSLHGLQRALERDDECTECHSPLYPAARHRLEYSGQRMLRRMPQRREVLLYVSWPQPEPFVAAMRDASLNGMQLVAAGAVAANQVVKVDGDLCQALARVAYCERDSESPDRWSIGVEFLTLRFRKSRGGFVSARA
jgi:DnaJ-like protein